MIDVRVCISVSFYRRYPDTPLDGRYPSVDSRVLYQTGF